ncbi:hypothetical protein LOTGIDRAFT_174858 [Lottia gigantea]|uniref:Autophagy-related protein 27 n=1 Tax=Lottia gigantea TaxID=225164 RepID=V4ARM9_LOTGI|nr:hypothetical protein LOTGIDRAFT_174858 [Lottia gigantea]ESO96336.1 hypothetical protein LOTGIDRAFT_174858 [Lottia gigantea]
MNLRRLSSDITRCIFVYFVFYLHHVWSLQCVTIGPCSCEFDDGSGIVDISSLKSLTPGQPKFKDVGAIDMYSYSYNPCEPFTEGDCIDVSSCQISADGMAQYPIGDQSSAAFSYDGTDVQIFYSKFTDVERQTFVTLKCDPSATTPTISAEGEQGAAQYYFTLTTNCACAGTCASSSPSNEDEGISTGTILCILLLVGGFLYIALGMAFMRTRRQASGAEMIPNRNFWTAIPGLIKDGFMFTIGKIRGKKPDYNEI